MACRNKQGFFGDPNNPPPRPPHGNFLLYNEKTKHYRSTERLPLGNAPCFPCSEGLAVVSAMHKEHNFSNSSLSQTETRKTLKTRLLIFRRGGASRRLNLCSQQPSHFTFCLQEANLSRSRGLLTPAREPESGSPSAAAEICVQVESTMRNG